MSEIYMKKAPNGTPLRYFIFVRQKLFDLTKWNNWELTIGEEPEIEENHKPLMDATGFESCALGDILEEAKDLLPRHILNHLIDMDKKISEE